jgi:hypothetical protein
LNHDILGLPNKSKILGQCRFPPTNPQKEPSVDCVPAPIVAEDHQNIAYFINQSSIFTLNKIEQE